MDNVIDVGKIWDFFTHYEDKLITQHMMVAENQSENTEIYITSEMGYPLFTVEIGGDIELAEASDDKAATEDLYDSLLSTYIYTDDTDYGVYTEEEYERREEIGCAAWDLISVLCQENPEEFGIEDAEIEDIVLNVEKMLYERFGVQITHPLVIELESGGYYVTPYPYLRLEDDAIEEDDDDDDFYQSDFDLYAALRGDDLCV